MALVANSRGSSQTGSATWTSGTNAYDGTYGTTTNTYASLSTSATSWITVAGYGFNKSHAAAYSLLAYQTAWLKVHYTAEFFCSNLTIELDDTDKIKVLIEDARKMGLHIESPDINRGVYEFEPVTDQHIRYGLGAIKGTGKAAIEAIVAAREADGPYSSLFDFYARVDRTRVNKRTVEALIKAGAFDSLQLNRASLLASIDRAHDFAQSLADNVNQGGLFDAVDSHASSTHEPELVRVTPWGIKERLTHEKSAIGYYLSGHLYDESAAEVQRFVKRRIADYSAEGVDYRWRYTFQDFSPHFGVSHLAHYFAQIFTERNAQADVNSIVEQFRALGAPRPANFFSGINCPALILTGSEDAAHQSAFELNQHLPDSEIRVLPGAGHACHMEQPWLFDQFIVEFLKTRGLFPS